MKHTLLLLACFLAMGSLFAQNTISGKVSSKEDNSALPGVNVVVKGTNTGTITDVEGNYSLSVPNNATLVFSFVGLLTKEVSVGTQTTVNVAMESDLRQLNEVVITSFGIAKEKKALGYAVQDFGAETLARANEPNLVNALQGKIAGVTINNSGGAAGAGASIIIRGVTSLSPNASNQPLFVVDGIPISNETVAGNVLPSSGSNALGSAEQFSNTNRAADINPDDIENISVLKGPAATALYGLRAANGVVIITTKKGVAGKGKVTFSSSVGFDEVLKTPSIQTTFREGWLGYARAFPDPDGTYVHPISGFGSDGFGYTYGFQTFGSPYTSLDRNYDTFRSFFRVGTRYNNSVSFSGGSDKTTYFASFARIDQNGIVHNTDWARTSFKLSGSTQISEKFKVSGSASYINSGGRRPTGGDKSIMSSLSYWSPSMDVNDYLNPDGTQRNYTQGVVDNPRYFADKSALTDDVNRLIGNLSLNYDIYKSDKFSADIAYQIGVDNYSDARVRVVPPNLDQGTQVGGFIVEENINYREYNSNLFLNLNYQINPDLKAALMLGNAVTDIQSSQVNVRGQRFTLPNFYDLSNATDFFTFKDAFTRRIVGLFADFRLDYKGIFFLGLTGRNDWSSTLPAQNRSFFYPAINASYVFSESLKIPENILTYGKVRASWATVAKDAPPKIVGEYFAGTSGFPFGTVNGFTRSTTAGSLTLRPETTTGFELGTELKFLRNRLGIDLTYFVQNSRDQIVTVPVSNVTGFARFVTNAGEIQNTGIELLLNAAPVKDWNGLTWDISLNWSRLRSEVLSMPEGLELIEFVNATWVASRIEKGGRVGDLYGFKFRYHENGQLLIDGNGFPVVDRSKLVKVGNAFPDWLGGITNTFSYKGATLSFLWEWRQGGQVYDMLFRNSFRNGILKSTQVRYEDVVFKGVTADGQPNTKAVMIEQNNFYRATNRINEAAELLVQDASWIRLRNVSLSYDLPKNLLTKLPFSNIRFTFTGNNLWLNTPFNGFDPESSAFGAGSNNFGFTGASIPAVRSYSLGLNVGF